MNNENKHNKATLDKFAVHCCQRYWLFPGMFDVITDNTL